MGIETRISLEPWPFGNMRPWISRGDDHTRLIGTRWSLYALHLLQIPGGMLAYARRTATGTESLYVDGGMGDLRRCHASTPNRKRCQTKGQDVR